MSSPDIPPPPPPPQAPKPADSMAVRRRQREGMMGANAGTMLTGPAGVTAGALNTGTTSLLGG